MEPGPNHESGEYVYRERDLLGEPFMEFRLVYRGPLFAEKSYNGTRPSRIKHKQDIRCSFHEQLDELWKVDSRLKSLARGFRETHDNSTGVTTRISNLDAIGEKNELGGIKWVPLVTDRWGSACSLNILFLRHEPKGGIVQT